MNKKRTIVIITLSIILIIILILIIVNLRSSKPQESAEQVVPKETIDEEVTNTDYLFDLTNSVDLNSPEEIAKRKEQQRNRPKTSKDINKFEWTYIDHVDGLYNDPYSDNYVGKYLGKYEKEHNNDYSALPTEEMPEWNSDDETKIRGGLFVGDSDTVGMCALITPNDDVYVYLYKEVDE